MAIDWKVETFDTLASTMDVIKERGEAGSPEGTVIVAKDQTRGIGRQGTQWIAKPGNLYTSILLRLSDIKNAGQYSYIASVTLADVVMPRLKSGFVYKHKWPNDGLINNLKFAGILPHLGKTEKTGENFLNLGIGINIPDAPDDKIALKNAFEKNIHAPELLSLYLEQLDANLTLYRNKGFSTIRTKWLENARGLGDHIRVRLPDTVLEGVFKGLDEEGGLLLGLDQGGQKVIRSGEVYFGNDV